MSLRLFALFDFLNPIVIKKIFFFLLLTAFFNAKSQDSPTLEDVKKEAKKLFENDEFTQAYKLYSQLVANYPKDAEFNYRLGVCMIYSEPNKKECLTYLKNANKNPEEAPKDIAFYLGKAHHINYLFDEAVAYYIQFKKTASASQQKKLQVDREITACMNGKKLLSSLSDVTVQNKKELAEADYFRTYDLSSIGGKLLVKPEDFKTSLDKKKKEKSIVFLPKGANLVYYSSYGDNGANGKDIYTSFKQADGTFSKGEVVKGINTPYDEDYPFLHPDGKSLYFASKGHNSMGGYDIFKSTYNESSGTWSEPVNLEFPINSPDDDFLFVTDSLEQTAYFSTGRQSPPGKIDVLKINIERRPIDLLVINGKVEAETPGSSIKVQYLTSEKEVGSFKADESGNYTMDLPNGSELLFTVETPGIATQSEKVIIPNLEVSRPCRQVITYEDSKLKITNFFEESANDESYLQYLKLIEKKAKLDVNTNDIQAQAQLASQAAKDSAQKVRNKRNSEGPHLVEESVVAAANPKGLNNKDLAAEVKKEAQVSKTESNRLSQDARDAYLLSQKQKDSGDKKVAEAEMMIIKADSISDEAEKGTAITAANTLKAEGESEQKVAAKLLVYAKSLEEDANSKTQISQLNTEFSTALSKTKTTSIGSDKQLTALQSQVISASSPSLGSNAYSQSIKKEIEEKQKQITALEKTNTENKTSAEEIKTEIGNLEQQLEKTKKKAAKQSISDQIVDLKTNQAEKEKQAIEGESQMNVLIKELNELKQEDELITRVNTETFTPPVPQVITSISLKEKYKDKIVISDISSVSSIGESNNQLRNYNLELDGLITNKKQELAKTKVAKNKQQLSAEIKQLEALKKSNQQALVKNENLIKDINKLANNKQEGPVAINMPPLTATSGSAAVVQLDNLNKQLDFNDNKNFEYNSYKDPEAQKLKIEADSKINDAIIQQKKLKEDVTSSKQELQSANQPGIDQLEIEAEDLMTKAQEKRKEGNTKTGAEKTKLLNQSKALESEANTKLIQASEITKKDNVVNYETNTENIENLIKEKKSESGDVSKVRNLMEEANIFFKQGSAIREEANSLNSAGAKLGNISNAEEKEAEALAKQQQALEILKKSNPDFVLKTAVTSESRSTADTSALSAKLSGVNEQINLVLDTKTSSYLKLYEANELELTQQLKEINSNQNLVDNTPSLKTDYLSGNTKLNAARDLKSKSDAAANPSEKLSDLINATKKQTEAITQFNNLANSLSIVASLNPNANPNPETANQPVNTATLSNVVNPEVEKPVDYALVNVSELGSKDTTTRQVLNYFESQNTSIRNEQAFRTSKNSISQLKQIDSELKNLKDDKANSEELNKILDQSSGSSELKKIAEGVTTDAEQLATQAAEKLAESRTKEGPEKENLKFEAKDLESQSLNKKYLASIVNQKAFDIDYKTNDIAIKELRSKMSTDNSTLSPDLDQLNIDIQNLSSQIQKLKEEANNLPNRSAKLGALSNVEEKEAELIQKQNAFITGLKKNYPDYVVRALPKDSITQMQETIPDNTAKENELNTNQFNELTNLTNAFTLEFESSKNQIPESLSPEQLAVKQNADSLNEASKRLVVEASQEANTELKIKKLTQAAKAGNSAVAQQSKLLPKTNQVFNMNKEDVAALTDIGSALQDANNDTETNAKQTLSIEGLEITKGNAYSPNKPIPFDSKIDDGLVFRVQIGAFKTQLPNNTFKGLSPVNGETTKSGYYRYTAGNFNKIEAANAVKNDLRKLGYRDAFVVAYRDGKRISASEAISMLAQEGKSVDLSSPQSAGITENLNIPKAILSEQAPAVNAQDLVQSTEIEKINGLFYTIQIGVYSRQATKQGLLNLQPIYTKQLPNGLFRYTAGIYNDTSKVGTDRSRVAELGITDAFITAYLNGAGISYNEGKKRQVNDASIKMENENPIIFPGAAVTAVSPLFPEPAVIPVDPTVQPFTNSVTSYPTSSEENGIKTNEEGVCFKVQIGAFSKQVPNDVAAKFSEIRSWPVENKLANGLYIYNIGNFSSAKFAKTLKDEAVRLGITDAFITVYRDGKKIYGAEANTLLAQ